ncbi:MAG: PHB depolymerase family esterase, partial [Deltaproteobacteria bacterium]|nr:PHB depolymerase family esterase [Deltaproteobacteria bacterium]
KLKMYLYVPANMPKLAPVVVALHGCTQTAQLYMMMSGWNTLADTYKFYVVYPEQQKKSTSPTATDRTGNPYQCFNWGGYYGYEFERGQGENQSIIDMVNYLKNDTTHKGYSVDPKRVFVTGLSAGGAMAVAMGALWPDVFAGVAPMAGLPFYCANSGNQPGSAVEQGAYACMGITSSFTPRTGAGCVSGTACMADDRKHTSAEWVDMVRAHGYPGYTGQYPRLISWHGNRDQYVDFVTDAEIVEQWTSLHGIDQTPDAAPATLKAGNTKHAYAEYRHDGDTLPLVATVKLNNMQHGIAVDPRGSGEDAGGQTGSYSYDWGIYSSYYSARFFGIAGGGTTTGQVTVSLSSPQDDALVQGTVTVAADASADQGSIVSVAFFLDGDAQPFRSLTAPPYSFDWNTDAVTADGEHTLKVVATDDHAGSAQDSAKIYVRTRPATQSCIYATNVEHISAGRAQECPNPYLPGGSPHACAVGSGDDLGLKALSSYVKETSPGYWTKVWLCM